MSTRSRGAGWLRAAATLVLLLGVVVGIPAVLAKGVGWPLPREVPDGDALKRIFDNNAITDDVVINALAVVVWIFWALLTVCVLAELVAALRGRRAGRVPLGGPLQSLAARLIAGIFTVSSLAAARPALAETTPLSAVLAQTTATTLPTAAQVATPPPEVAPVPEVRSYVVCPDDTLWDIAEAHLGNPQRWPEIFELNKGRSQPDGRWLRNPDLIRPGWKLDLPDDAVIPAADFPAPPSSTPAPAPAAVSPPTSSPAPTTPAGTVAAPTTVAPTTTAVPTTIAPAATSEAPSDPIPVQPVVDRNPIPKPRRVHSRPGVKLNGRSIIGAGLLAAGVVGVIDRRRRAQQRRRPAGQSLLLPQPDLAGCELALRISADPEGAELVDLALRAMADGVRAEGLRVPEVLGVRLRQRSLDILLASPLPDAPALFAARDGGRCWELPRGFDAEALHAAAEGVPAPLPALVSVGRTDDGGMLLIDVEEGGLTSVIGNPSEARAVLTAMATELATSRWVDDLSLVLVGFGDTLASLERVRVVDTVDEVLDGLEREAIGLSEALTAVGCPSAVDARVARTGEPTPTIVLCCADPLGAEATERLVRLTTAAGYAGVAAIVAGELPDALLYLRIDDGVVHVSPLGIDVVPQLLAPEEDDAIGELFDLAAAEPDDGLVAEDVVVDLTVEPDDGAPPEAPDMDDAEVLVRVLGPVEIVGPPPFQRAKAAELVVYLALHRGAAIGGLFDLAAAEPEVGLVAEDVVVDMTV